MNLANLHKLASRQIGIFHCQLDNNSSVLVFHTVVVLPEYSHSMYSSAPLSPHDLNFLDKASVASGINLGHVTILLCTEVFEQKLQEYLTMTMIPYYSKMKLWPLMIGTSLGKKRTIMYLQNNT